MDESRDTVGQKRKKRNVFVTVGTTSFDALVEAMDSEELIQTLIEKGYDSLTIQRGRGAYVPKHVVSATSTSSRSSTSARRTFFKVEVVEFLPSLDGVLKDASLVISHAGAGSVFESLSLWPLSAAAAAPLGLSTENPRQKKEGAVPICRLLPL